MALSPIASAAEIKVLCTQALKGTMAKLGPQYESKTGDKLLITYGATGQLLARLNQGEPVDVIIVTGPALADLAKSGKVVDSSRADVARSGIGVAIRRGAPRIDISTVDAFKKTLLAAKYITYTDPAAGGASAVYFVELIKKLGIAEQLAPKTKLAPGGTSSAALVVSGEADLAVQNISELILVPGIEIAGPLPPQIQLYIVLSAGISKAAANPAAAARLIKFLSSPAVAPALREAGLEPPR
jgi:molybdate transport system substrate-binding protein